MKKTFIHQHSCSLKYTILFYDMGSYFKTLLFFSIPFSIPEGILSHAASHR